MKLYNTLTKQLGTLPSPDEQKQLKMFVCGPTVYDYIHIGNARTFVIFDAFAKYLRYQGYDVNYIQNITDIDNKIIERADKEGIDALQYAQKFSEFFKEDMAALGVTAPEYKKATDHIPEVISQVQKLLDNGHAYTIEGDGIYFDLSKFPDYGKLSGRTAEMANDAVSRIDDSDKKRNRGDFALWKFKQDNDPSWPAPFGEGRPGWHIEDTAITEKYFGPQYDIHGGGQDLKFPHHEAEIAQQESASGLKPFVKIWMHAGFLVNKDEKMSKSLGNFETLREILKEYPAEALRFFFLSAHYRSTLTFNEKVLAQSNSAVQKISQTKISLLLADKESGTDIDVETARKNFYNALDDDFNTAEAMGNVFTFIRQLNPLIAEGTISKKSAQDAEALLEEINNILGIIPAKYKAPPQVVENLNQEREKYRNDGNYTEADRVRIQIETMGYQIEDTPFGPLLKKK